MRITKKNSLVMFCAAIFILMFSFAYASLGCANASVGTIFCDDFETGNLNKWADFDPTWDGPHSARYSVTSNPQRVKSGTYALEGLITPSNGYGNLMKRLTPELDEVWVKFDVMFEEGFKNMRGDGYGMHLLSIDAFADISQLGVAGKRPNGTDFFVSTVDPQGYYNNPTLGPFVFYSYYPDMCAVGVSPCYGVNIPQMTPSVPPPLGIWQNVLIHVKANTPGLRDGFQRLYINGELKINNQNMRWRDTSALKINLFRIFNYMPGALQTQHIWMDNLIISSSPISTLTPTPSTSDSIFYVATNGNDANSCEQARNINSPRKTINNGLKCLSAGSTLYVRAGNYDEGITNSIPSGTSWSNKIRVAAYLGESVWLKPLVFGKGNNGYVIFLGGAAGVSPKYIEFDGINLDASHMPYVAVRFDEYAGANPNHIRMQNAEVIQGPTGGAGAILIGSHDNEFINLKVHGGGTNGGCGTPCASYAFYIAGDNNLIENSDMYEVSMAGVHIYSSSGSSDNNIVRNNRIHDITRSGDTRMWGIIVSGNNNILYNNIIYDISFPYAENNAGIFIYTGSWNKVYNNVIYNNTLHGIFIYSSSSNNEVRNNIVYGNKGTSFRDQGKNTIQSNNLLDIDPFFVNVVGKDFRVQPESPAIDKGMTISTVTTDFEGKARPQGSAYDIGAYEFVAESTQPPTSTNIPGDLNNDQKVDLLDVMLVLKDFGKPSGFDAKNDINKDNVINILDVIEIIKNWK